MSQPVVLFIDDTDELTGDIASQLDRYSVRGVPRHPDEVSVEDLDEADLTLLDFDLGDWPSEQDPERPLQAPPDGLGFAQVIRAHHRARPRSAGAVGLLSDNIGKLFDDQLAHVTGATVARLHHLEWAFDKAEERDEDALLAPRIAELAHAVVRARDLWPLTTDEPASEDGDAPDPLAVLLGLSSADPWYREARVSIVATQPPAHELAARSNGLTVIRWLAQRILAYPTFLLEDRYAAALLGVTYLSLREALENREFEEQLNPAKYTGALDGLLGRQWWRDGLVHQMVQWTGGQPLLDHDTIKKIGFDLEPIPRRSVVTLNQQLKPYATTSQRDHVVRIRPDDWPSFASPGYATIELLTDHTDDPRVRMMRAYVEPADLVLLDEPV